jgi:hypothetical protein
MADSSKNIKKRAERPAFLSTTPDFFKRYFSNNLSIQIFSTKFVILYKNAADTGKVTANTKAPMDATAPGISSKCSGCHAFSASN